MYTSLHKVDLVVEVEGGRLVVQTDHRAAGEIEAEPEISVLFALTRVANATSWLASEGHRGRVQYTLPGEAPPVLREALTAAGALLSERAKSGPEDLGPGSPERVQAMADQAFRALAARVLARMDTSDPTDALRRLEAETVLAKLDREADEGGWYRRVLELASLGGELIRARAGGSWVPHDQALVPFAFRIDQGALVLPTNRAERFVGGAVEDSLMQLLAAVDDVLADRGSARVMPSLRNRHRIPLDRVAWEPLIEPDHEDLPVVVYGEDGQATFAVYNRDSLDRSIEELASEARANLATEEVQLERFDVDGLAIAAVGGAFFAAEKVLDSAFVHRLHRMLDAPRLAVSVPARGVLMATSADQAAERLGLFAIVARRRFEESEDQQISPAVLLLEDGKVVGYAAIPLPGTPIAES